MKSFEEYLKEGKVRTGSSSKSEAKSLKKQAENRFKQQIGKSELTEENATFKFEDAYEALRQRLQSFMAEQGYKPYNHEAIIAYAKENNILTEAEANKINQFRKLRNDIRYRGETTQKERAEEIIKLARKHIIKEK